MRFILFFALALAVTGCNNPKVWNALANAGNAMQGYPSNYNIQTNRNVGYGNKVYSEDECTGPVIGARCHGSILPKSAYHKTCHGVLMANGECTGPMF